MFLRSLPVNFLLMFPWSISPPPGKKAEKQYVALQLPYWLWYRRRRLTVADRLAICGRQNSKVLPSKV